MLEDDDHELLETLARMALKQSPMIGSGYHLEVDLQFQLFE